MVAPEREPEEGEARYVLITQCLQNDFLLNAECRLSLPEPIVRGGAARPAPDWRRRDARAFEDCPPRRSPRGPLGLFLEQTIGRRRRGEDGQGVLHVINIRDWHVPDDNYDFGAPQVRRPLRGGHLGSGLRRRPRGLARSGRIRSRRKRRGTSSREASGSTTCMPTRSSTSGRGAPTSGRTSASSARPRSRSCST